MTEQELRERIREKLKTASPSLQNSVNKLTELLLEAYNRGLDDGIEITKEFYRGKYVGNEWREI